MKTESLFLQGVSARLQASQQSEAQPTPGSHAGGGGGACRKVDGGRDVTAQFRAPGSSGANPVKWPKKSLLLFCFCF